MPNSARRGFYISYFVRRQYMGVDAKIAVHGDVCRYRVDIVRS